MVDTFAKFKRDNIYKVSLPAHPCPPNPAILPLSRVSFRDYVYANAL